RLVRVEGPAREPPSVVGWEPHRLGRRWLRSGCRGQPPQPIGARRVVAEAAGELCTVLDAERAHHARLDVVSRALQAPREGLVTGEVCAPVAAGEQEEKQACGTA